MLLSLLDLLHVSLHVRMESQHRAHFVLHVNSLWQEEMEEEQVEEEEGGGGGGGGGGRDLWQEEQSLASFHLPRS